MESRAPGVELLYSRTQSGRHVCVGLDTTPSRLPRSVPGVDDAERVVNFNRSIIEATAAVACAYKPNVAFYEGLGASGWRVLTATIHAVREIAPGTPVIIDAKRADIGSTNRGYVDALDALGADAVTVHPYLGREAMRPFLEHPTLLLFVLARTSNPGADEFQDLMVAKIPLYQYVARAVARGWNSAGNCGLVVGATYPRELRVLRSECGPAMPFLVPGVGAQGGSLVEVVDAHTAVGSSAFVINASRSIIYASAGADYASAAYAEARRMHDAVTARVTSPGATTP